MKQFKRIVSFLLAVLVLVPNLTACKDKEDSKITTGEFFAIFMEAAGLYYVSDEPSDDDIGYQAEAQAMVDWGLLPEDQAFEDLNGNVTKETVLTVCLNNMYFVKEGSVDSLKDAKKCRDAQLMANAVATGLTELENGYIDAKEQITRNECLEYITKSLEIESNSHFADGSGTVEYDYGEDVDVFTSDDIDPDEIQILDYTNEQYGSEYNPNEGTEVVTVSAQESGAQLGAVNLASVQTAQSDVQTLAATASTAETFRVLIPQRIFENAMKKPKVGSEIIYMPWQGAQITDRFSQANELMQKGFSGKLLSATLLGLQYDCLFQRLDDETLVKGMKIDNYGKDATKENLSHTILSTKVDGFTIKFNKLSNGYSVNVEKTFTITQNKYNNWRDWKIEPTMSLTASITDFHIDCDNIKSIFSNSKKEKTLFDLSYTTKQEFSMETGGLRLAPDSNRNGKFTSNVTKSRFTSGAGAKYIKVGSIKIDIPEIGLSIPITVYLEISFDGKIKVVFDETTNIKLVKQNGQFKLSKETCKSKTFEVTGNLDVGVQLEIGLNFILMKKSLMVIYGKAGANITAYCKVSTETSTYSGYADAEDLAHEHTVQADMDFCLDISCYLYLEAGLCEGASYGSYLADLLKALDVDISKLNVQAKSPSKSLLHLENGLSFKSDLVSECTMDEGMEVNKDGEIKLDSYKETMSEKESIAISVLSVPMKESKIEANGGFNIKVKDPSVVSVEYDEELNVLNIQALKEGSTEVEIKIVKKKKTKKKKATYYTQEISITVNGSGKTKQDITTFDEEEDAPVIQLWL